MSELSQAESESGASEFPEFSLADARERLGQSVEQVAASLRLSISQVHALEQGDYSKLPSIVFTRGYIRAYARLVGLNGDALVRQFDASYGGEQKSASIRSISRVQPSGSSGPGVSLSMLLLVVVIVAATFWWWKTQYGHEVALTSLPESAVAVDTADGETLVLSGSEPVVDHSIDSGLSSEEVTPAQDASAQLAADATELQATEVSVEAEEVALNATTTQAPGDAMTADAAVAPAQDKMPAEATTVGDGGDVAATGVQLATTGLVVHFKDDCWVTIKDANGKTLFNNMRRAGEELRIAQNGPLNILLGRTSAVSELTFAGSSVDLAPFSNKNVARLTLPLN